MAGVFINSSQAVYASENQFDTLSSQISLLQTMVDPVMMQVFKTSTSLVPIALIGGGTFVILSGYDQQSIIPGSTFWTIISSGVYQYNGPANYFDLSYTVSGYPSTQTTPITFCLTKNNALLPASAQIQDFTVISYESVASNVIIELSPGDQISLKASINSATNDTFQIENIKISAIKITPFD